MPKASQSTCRVSWEKTDGSGAIAGEIGPHLVVIWGTRCYFTLLRCHQFPSRLVTEFLGTLCSSTKQINAPSLFDEEHGLAFHSMQGNQASSRGKGEVSWIFSSCGRNLAYNLELQRGWPFKNHVCSATSGHCPVMSDTS